MSICFGRVGLKDFNWNIYTIILLYFYPKFVFYNLFNIFYICTGPTDRNQLVANFGTRRLVTLLLSVMRFSFLCNSKSVVTVSQCKKIRNYLLIINKGVILLFVALLYTGLQIHYEVHFEFSINCCSHVQKFTYCGAFHSSTDKEPLPLAHR